MGVRVIRAVLFDLGDTLFRLQPFDDERVKAAFAASLVSRVGLAEAQALATTAALYEEHTAVLRASYQDGRTDEVGVAAAIGESLRRLGDAAAGLADELQRHLGETDIARWEEPVGRLEVLDGLKSRGLRIAFVSNTGTAPSLMDSRLEEFGLRSFADVAVYSSAVGQRKPHPAIYEAALRALAVEAPDAIFIGDRVREDVRGPQALGMRAVLSHEFRQEDPADSGPLAVVGHIREAAELIAGQ